MRVNQVLVGVGIAAALIISIALVVRNLPTENPATKADAPQQAAMPSASSAAPPPAQTAAPAVSEPAPPVVAQPAPAPPAPPPPAPMQGRPGNLFDLESLPSPGIIGPGAPPPGAQATTPPTQTDAAVNPSAPAARLQLTPEQSAKLSYVLLSHTITQAEVAEFPLRIGGKVPPEVLLTPLPRDVADAVPDYTLYSYAIAQNQIVIVVTERREINALIPL
jgi:hypothetical protein